MAKNTNRFNIKRFGTIWMMVLFCLAVLAAQRTFSPSMFSFTSGQVSPKLEARSEFQKYDSSCRVLENFLVHTQGPVSRRPGTRFITDANDSTSAVRLIPFEYSTDDAYVLTFEDGIMGVFRTTSD